MNLTDEATRRTQKQITIMLAMYIGYASLMVCRNTLIASSAAMMEDPTLSLDKESFGHLMSWHSAGAIAGKLITGPGADLLGGRKMFLLALAFTGAANIGFALCTSFIGFAIFNFFGQFAKAGGWPAMTKIVRSWYPESKYGSVWSIISTSSRVGTIAAGLALGYLLMFMSWRAVFVASAILIGGVAAWIYFSLHDRPDAIPDEIPDGDEFSESHLTQNTGNQRKIGNLEEPQSLESKSQHPLDKHNLLSACGYFLRSGQCWAICAGIVFLTVMMDFLNFIPIYLSESLGLSASVASMAGTSFPIGMFVALIVSGFLYDRFSKRQLAICLTTLLMIGISCVLCLWGMDLAPKAYRVPLSITCLFVLGFSISPAYYVPMSVFSVSFGGRHSGFLVSFIDIFGYAGALVFNFFSGSIAEHYGWDTFLGGLTLISSLAMLSMSTFLYLDQRSTGSTTPVPAN